MRVLYIFKSNCGAFQSIYDSFSRATDHGIALVKEGRIKGYTISPIHYFPEPEKGSNGMFDNDN